MEAGCNTDFQKVFDLILKVPEKGNLKPEDMIKRVFVFSDKEFDEASSSSRWETDYAVIQKEFENQGYGNAVPQIVFRNLRHSKATPVTGTQSGVALLSGFSKNLIKLFLDNDGEVQPDLAMEAAISGQDRRNGGDTMEAIATANTSRFFSTIFLFPKSLKVEVKEGKIVSIVKEEEKNGKTKLENVIDYGEAVVMPGLVDVHAHLDDPGRAEWEGFPSGTQAAAAGGITTLVDMPLNSDPSTVSRETLQLKIKAAESRIYVDVGFWGGLVPENAFNASALEDLLNAGVLGLKSFMCPSGINDFPMTNASHIKEGLSVLAKYRRPLLVHAEKQLDLESDLGVEGGSNDARSYSTYLKTRPASWEEAAIRDLLTLTKDTRIGAPAEGAHLHIVHLSDSSNSLDLIKDAKSGGDSVTVETCPHYLAFSAEEIRDGDTRFKCSPPIRDAANKEKLWEALLAGHVDMISSDHSPTLPELKLLDDGDFLRAWGGISSLQFVLPVTWSYGQKYGVTLEQLALWWSERPARLAGQELKGAIAIGYHADMVVWDPDVEFDLDDDPVYLKHSGISAYMGTKLSGKVSATFVRGNLVFKEGKHAPAACGRREDIRGDGGRVAELQWKRMVDDMLKPGKMRNCLAVSDVSGSMEGTPMKGFRGIGDFRV
ncbi:PREDICTED: allantoinase [Prunus dulcis]|uniref:allantoinase n=1 Tax=Prunus dulcis TaxID=3755 RepID=A0A5E4F6A0_PRUDU|nr:PREDICTED: allantoinase [Prunus dulcis]